MARVTAVVVAANEAMRSGDVTKADVKWSMRFLWKMNVRLALLRLRWQHLELLFVRPFQRLERLSSRLLNVTPWSKRKLTCSESAADTQEMAGTRRRGRR